MRKSVKGLLLKDIKIIKSQMRFFLVTMIIVGMFLTGKFNQTFFVGYTAVLSAFLLMTTFGFDEFENGFAFLFTLPISRKDYVAEKYLFGILLVTVPFALVSICSWIALAVQDTEMHFVQYLVSVSSGIPMAFLILALEIPLQIKFGQAKSRLISVIMIAGMTTCLSLIGTLNAMSVADGMESVSTIGRLGMGLWILMAVGGAAVLLFLSYTISCRIIEKKEF